MHKTISQHISRTFSVSWINSSTTTRWSSILSTSPPLGPGPSSSSTQPPTLRRPEIKNKMSNRKNPKSFQKRKRGISWNRKPPTKHCNNFKPRVFFYLTPFEITPYGCVNNGKSQLFFRKHDSHPKYRYIPKDKDSLKIEK